MYYVKRPIVIEAFRYGYERCPDWFIAKVTNNEVITYEHGCNIATLEGVMTCMNGDYVIKGVVGELYSCRCDVFNLTYDKVDKEVIT